MDEKTVHDPQFVARFTRVLFQHGLIGAIYKGPDTAFQLELKTVNGEIEVDSAVGSKKSKWVLIVNELKRRKLNPADLTLFMVKEKENVHVVAVDVYRCLTPTTDRSVPGQKGREIIKPKESDLTSDADRASAAQFYSRPLEQQLGWIGRMRQRPMKQILAAAHTFSVLVSQREENHIEDTTLYRATMPLEGGPIKITRAEASVTGKKHTEPVLVALHTEKDGTTWKENVSCKSAIADLISRIIA